MHNIQDRVQGVIIGLAAGDKIGGPIRMATHLAESLIVNQGFYCKHVVNKYLEWWKEGAFDTGPVAERVLNLVELGIPYQEAVIEVDKELNGFTAGCNPAHRSSPLAMSQYITDEQLSNAAIQEASITHKNILAGDTAVATAVLCRNLIHGTGWSTALQKTMEGRTSQICQALEPNSRTLLRKGGFAPDVLSAAIYFINESEDFVEALDKSIKFAGVENYCPVLVGSIGGTR